MRAGVPPRVLPAFNSNPTRLRSGPGWGPATGGPW